MQQLLLAILAFTKFVFMMTFLQRWCNVMRRQTWLSANNLAAESQEKFFVICQHNMVSNTNLDYSLKIREIGTAYIVIKNKTVECHNKIWAWILDVMLIALVSKVTLVEWLSKFAQCWVPRESVLRGSGAHKATSTAQNLKVTLIEWHLKLMLLALHQVFTPNNPILQYFIIIFY